MTDRFKAINHEYLKYLREDSMLSVRDVQEIFGFKNYNAVHDLVSRGKLPRATHKGKGYSLHNSGKRYWLKNEIMPYIIEMMEEENSNEKT